MRERDISAGAPCWIDLSTSDTAGTRDFYTALFGWTAAEPDPQFGGYFMFSRDGVPVAGCMPAMPDSPTDFWSVYLTVEDASKTLEAAAAAGGQVYVPAMQVGEAGTMGVVADPGGASIGLWQADQFPGLSGVGEAGQPSWFELYSRDYDTVLAFYRQVFGWDLSVMADDPEFRYSTFSHGGDPLAGVMDASAFGPEGPSGWAIYFWVDDTDAAVAKAQALGGAVVGAAEDTPYGRLATVTDPSGATFKLMAANEQMPAASS
jgi:predicted enzyme related to lactoylglutathione lyase